jgi:hypothetical protein
MHLFTKETAREMVKLSIAKRAENRAKRKSELRLKHPHEHVTDKDLAYKALRLIRVRKQLDRIDEMMMAEVDPSKLDRLASAQARLSEQERILVGRPLPGSLKPINTKPSKQSPASAPSEVSEADST